MTTKPQRRPLVVADRIATVLLSGVLLLMAVLAFPAAAIEGMRSTGCRGPCHAEVIGAGTAVIAVGIPLVAVAALVALGLVAQRMRWRSWVPAAGLAAAFGLLVLGDLVIGAGVPT